MKNKKDFISNFSDNLFSIVINVLYLIVYIFLGAGAFCSIWLILTLFPNSSAAMVVFSIFNLVANIFKILVCVLGIGLVILIIALIIESAKKLEQKQKERREKFRNEIVEDIVKKIGRKR
jgi:ABC-type multidrug transport system fused ATPase/permease subunit